LSENDLEVLRRMKKGPESDAKWSKACFRISGDALQPDEVTRELDLEATSSGLKGGALSSSRRKQPLRTSIWILNSPLDDHTPLEDHLAWLLDTLEPRLGVINAIAKQHKTDFFCGFSSDNGQGGCTFDAVLLERLARLGIPLGLDLYPPCPIEFDLDQE
jgi:hypothetical protein